MKRFLAVSLVALMALSNIAFASVKGTIVNGEKKTQPDTSTTTKTETGSITKINQPTTTTEETTETTTSAPKAISVGGKDSSVTLSSSAFEYLGNTMVPLREIAEALGYTVSWNGEVKAVELTGNGVNVEFNAGINSYAISKGQGAATPVSLGTAPVIKNSVTYVPLMLFRMIDSGNNDIILRNDTVVISPKVKETSTETTTSNVMELGDSKKKNIDNGGKKQAAANSKEEDAKRIVNETTTFQISSEAATEATTSGEKAIGKNSVNPMVEYDSAAIAATELGIKLNTVDIEGYTLDKVYIVSGQILQLDYTKADNNISVRIGKGTDDVSGDYRKYMGLSKYTINGCLVALEGDRVNFPKATWTDKTYAYSITNDGNMKEHELVEIVKQAAYFVEK